MSHPLAPFVDHHVRHDIRDCDCDCAPWVIELVLGLRDLAEEIARIDWPALKTTLDAMGDS